MHKWKWILIGLIVFTILGIGTAFGYDQIASPRVEEQYPPQGEILTVEGHKVHTLCTGEGDTTVILFHGFGGGAIDLLPLMATLENDMRVCAFDRLGNDYSGPLPNEWDIETALEWQNAVIDELTDDPIYVAGHSLGGAFALRYAARFPTRGIILLDGLTPDVADAVVTRMDSYSRLGGLTKIGLLRPLARLIVHPNYASTDLYPQMIALRSRSENLIGISTEGTLANDGLNGTMLADAVANLDVPLLLFVAGETDVPEGIVFTNSLLALDAMYPQSALVMVPDANHYLITTHVDTLGTEMTKWMGQQ